MKGNELPQCEIEDIDAWVKKNFKKKLGPDGSIPYRQRSGDEHLKAYHLEREDLDWEKSCESYTFSKLAQLELNIPYYANYAYGGYSNNATLATLIQHLDEIDDNTLVVVGITYPYRKTRLGVHWDGDKFKCSSPAKESSHINNIKDFEMLLEFSDDILSCYVNAHGFVSSIKDILQGKKYIIIDSVSQYIAKPNLPQDSEIELAIDENIIETKIKRAEEELLNPEIVEYLEQWFKDNLFEHSISESMSRLYTEGKRYRCVLTHPNHLAHKYFADDYFIPWIKQQEWL